MTDHSAVRYQAHSYGALGRYDEAIELIGKALATDPDNAALLIQLAGLLIDAGRNEEAESTAGTAIRFAPDSAEAKLHLARAVMNVRNDGRTAVSLAEDALRLQPDLPWAHLILAAAISILPSPDDEQKARARAAYAVAIADGAYAPWYATAALIEHRFGDRKAVIRLIDAGLETAPDHPDLLQMKARTVVGTKRISMLSGLLAANPFNEIARSDLTNIHRFGHRQATALMWGAPFALACLALFASGPWTGVAVAAVWGYVATVWRTHRDEQKAFPAAFVELQRRTVPLYGLIRIFRLSWIVIAVPATILIIIHNAVGLWAIGVVYAMWAITRIAQTIGDVRNTIRETATEADAQAGTQAEATAGAANGSERSALLTRLTLTRVLLNAAASAKALALGWIAIRLQAGELIGAPGAAVPLLLAAVVTAVHVADGAVVIALNCPGRRVLLGCAALLLALAALAVAACLTGLALFRG